MKANYLIFKLCLFLTIILFVILLYLEFFCKFEHLSFYMNVIFAIFGGSALTSVTAVIIYYNEVREKRVDIFCDLVGAYRVYDKYFSSTMVKDLSFEDIRDLRMKGVHTYEIVVAKMDYLEIKLEIGIVQNRNWLGNLMTLRQLVFKFDKVNKEMNNLLISIRNSPINGANKEYVVKYWENCISSLKEMKKIILENSRKEFSKDFVENMELRL